jgi:hypothetical protein
MIFRTSKHKFNAKPQICDEKHFSSKLEASYYKVLKLAQSAKERPLMFFLRQVPFDLPGNITYRLDFMEFWAPKEGELTGDIIFTEVKGFMTTEAKIKIAQVEEIYGININIVKKI